jgi:hypothetical protein
MYLLHCLEMQHIAGYVLRAATGDMRFRSEPRAGFSRDLQPLQVGEIRAQRSTTLCNAAARALVMIPRTIQAPTTFGAGRPRRVPRMYDQSTSGHKLSHSTLPPLSRSIAIANSGEHGLHP